MLAGFIYKYNPKDGFIEKIASGKNVPGFALNKKDGLVYACHGGLYFWDRKNNFRLIANTYKGDFLRSNDAIADAKGRFIFGTTFYGENVDKNYKLGKLYSVDRDGSISILEEGVHLSNGLGFSPDNKIMYYMYYTNTVIRTIYAYNYDMDRRTISNRIVFVKVPDNEGIPDGMTVDSEGYVWSAQWYRSCIVRYDPDGKVERYIKTPARQTSSLIFGGKNLTDIYVTTAAKSVRLQVAPSVYDFNASDIGGPVYRYNFGIKGKPEYFADINI